MKLSLKELLKVSLTQRVSWATLLLSGGFFTGMAKEIFGDSGVVQKLCQIRESLKKGDRDIAKENLEGVVSLIFPGAKVSYRDVQSEEFKGLGHVIGTTEIPSGTIALTKRLCGPERIWQCS